MWNGVTTGQSVNRKRSMIVVITVIVGLAIVGVIAWKATFSPVKAEVHQTNPTEMPTPSKELPTSALPVEPTYTPSPYEPPEQIEETPSAVPTPTETPDATPTPEPTTDESTEPSAPSTAVTKNPDGDPGCNPDICG